MYDDEPSKAMMGGASVRQELRLEFNKFCHVVGQQRILIVGRQVFVEVSSVHTFVSSFSRVDDA